MRLGLFGKILLLFWLVSSCGSEITERQRLKRIGSSSLNNAPKNVSSLEEESSVDSRSLAEPVEIQQAKEIQLAKEDQQAKALWEEKFKDLEAKIKKLQCTKKHVVKQKSGTFLGISVNDYSKPDKELIREFKKKYECGGEKRIETSYECRPRGRGGIEGSTRTCKGKRTYVVNCCK